MLLDMRYICAIEQKVQKKLPKVADLVPSLNHKLMNYESIKSKFQILDTFIKFYKYVEHNLNLWLIRNEEVSEFQI